MGFPPAPEGSGLAGGAAANHTFHHGELVEDKDIGDSEAAGIAASRSSKPLLFHVEAVAVGHVAGLGHNAHE